MSRTAVAGLTKYGAYTPPVEAVAIAEAFPGLGENLRKTQNKTLSSDYGRAIGRPPLSGDPPSAELFLSTLLVASVRSCFGLRHLSGIDLDH